MLKEQFLKWSILLLFFISTLPAAHTQSPGYLGKKLSIGIGSSFYPAIYGPTKNKKGIANKRGFFASPLTTQGFAMNTSLEISIDYAHKRYSSFGIYGNTYKTGMIVYYDPFLNNRESAFQVLNVNTLGLQYSRFKSAKGALAPIGRYTSIGVEGLFTSGEPTEEISLTYKKTILNLATKYMMSYPLSERLLLKVGGSIRLPIINPLKILTVLEYDSILFEENENAFAYAAMNRTFYHGIMRFELNLAYLIK